MASFHTRSSISSKKSYAASSIASLLPSDIPLSLRRVRKWQRQRLSGWRFGVMCAAITCVLVFCINVSFAIYGVSKAGAHGGIGTMFAGSCDTIKDLSLWLHLAINVLSTLLLGGSNYTMQCLISPTRQEIDRAHSEKKWLDIGVPSIRNLKHIATTRMLLWVGLSFSSIPLHLM
jgi:hypothetical protein